MSDDGLMFDTLDFIVVGAVAVCLAGYFYMKSAGGSSTMKSSFEENDSSMNDFMGDMEAFPEMMTKNNKDMIVFYGSQTGTAEEFASRLVIEAAGYGFNALAADFEDYDVNDFQNQDLKGKFVVFCIATYGEGDPTDNAIPFFDFLKEEADPEEMAGNKFAVFSLGNSTYEHYQAAGRFVDAKLEALGWERMYERGEGNDDANIEEDFCQWKKEFWPAICEKFGKEVPADIDALNVLARKYEMITHDSAANAKTGQIGNSKANRTADVKNPVMVPVTVNRELFKDSDRSCRHVELDITNVKVSYQAGDHVGIYATNPKEMVERLGAALKCDLNTVISFRSLDPTNKKEFFPNPCTIKTALTHYLDISHLPKQHHLRVLAEYAEGADKERLMVLSSEEGREEFHKFIDHDVRSFAEVIDEFKTLNPPIDHLLEMLPRLQCRYYSISSSPKKYYNSIHVTAVVVRYDTPLGRHAKGVCTNFLADLDCSDGDDLPQVPIFVRPSTFRLPKNRKTDVIMIGPGTGLAPFRGFIQDRAYHHAKREEMGETVLFYGCRKRTEDYLYDEEMTKYKEDFVITKLFLAFSREQEHKIYVTHLLKENRDDIWNMINNGAHLYICGEGKYMAKDVHDIIHDLIKEKQGISDDEAVVYLQKMELEKRYSLDVW